MGRIVCKFGGSSLADAGQFRKVRTIVAGDPRRRVVVVSAPGKRHAADAKVTDLLFVCHDSTRVHADFSGVFDQVRERFLEIERQLGVDAKMDAHLTRLGEAISAGVTRDYVASRGEHLSGLLMAAYLGATFVDPKDSIVIGPHCTVDRECYPSVAAALADENEQYVIPGFYGADVLGECRVFSRGGSDITGAIAARAIDAVCYENWTDVSGLRMADPRIVDSPKRMAEVTFDEIRELSYMGASVLHDDAVAPVRESRIPIEIRNTNAPEEPGTRIVSELSEHQLKHTEIAGIAGKDTFAMITLTKALMNREIGFARRVFTVLEEHDVSFEHCPTSIDSLSVILESGQLEGKLDDIVQNLEQILQPDRLEVVPRFALIAVVGEEMAHTIGISAKVFGALRDAHVNVVVMNQGASELNIIVGVAMEDYQVAIRALYQAFVDGKPPSDVFSAPAR